MLCCGARASGLQESPGVVPGQVLWRCHAHAQTLGMEKLSSRIARLCFEISTSNATQEDANPNQHQDTKPQQHGRHWQLSGNCLACTQASAQHTTAAAAPAIGCACALTSLQNGSAPLGRVPSKLSCCALLGGDVCDGEGVVAGAWYTLGWATRAEHVSKTQTLVPRCWQRPHQR